MLVSLNDKGSDGSSTVIMSLCGQPLASVTVRLYVPGPKSEIMLSEDE